MAGESQEPPLNEENRPETILCRLEEIWSQLAPTGFALTVAWAIYALGQVIRRLNSVGINLGLEDEIAALTLLLEENEEPPIMIWRVYKEEVDFLLVNLRKCMDQTPFHEKGNGKQAERGGNP